MLVTTSKAAEMCGIAPRTINRWIEEGKLTAVMELNRYMVESEDVRLLNEQRIAWSQRGQTTYADLGLEAYGESHYSRQIAKAPSNFTAAIDQIVAAANENRLSVEEAIRLVLTEDIARLWKSHEAYVRPKRKRRPKEPVAA